MKKYVKPEMEIDRFEENDGLILTESFADDWKCLAAFAYGEGEDPWYD